MLLSELKVHRLVAGHTVNRNIIRDTYSHYWESEASSYDCGKTLESNVYMKPINGYDSYSNKLTT
jgi:hypothetical protein